MGIDRIEKARKPDKFKMGGARIWLPLDVLQGAAYSNLSHISAKALLLDLTGQLRAKHGEIINNGDLTTAHSVLSKLGWKNPKTIRSAARMLEQSRLIVKTRQGHRPNTATLYAVTWLPLNESSKLDITAKGYPLHAYRLAEKLPPLKSIPDGQKLPIKADDRGKKYPSKPHKVIVYRQKIPLCAGFHSSLMGKKYPPSIYTN